GRTSLLSLLFWRVRRHEILLNWQTLWAREGSKSAIPATMRYQLWVMNVAFALGASFTQDAGWPTTARAAGSCRGRPPASRSWARGGGRGRRERSAARAGGSCR